LLGGFRKENVGSFISSIDAYAQMIPSGAKSPG
jgi:hypothetical protein